MPSTIKILVLGIALTFCRFAKAQSLPTEEALKRCSNYVWAATFQTNGEFFTYSVYKSPYTDWWTVDWKQLHNLKFEIIPVALTSVDQLNGIEWKGSLQITFESVRTLHLTKDTPTGNWSEWAPGSNTNYPIEKKRGTWRLDLQVGSLLFAKPDATLVAQVLDMPSSDHKLGIDLP